MSEINLYNDKNRSVLEEVAAQSGHEFRIRQAFNNGNFKLAATLTLEAYGPELMGFLAACHLRVTEAEEVFSLFTEDFWLGLSRFKWQCSMRTWVYTLARNADRRYRRSPHTRAGRHVSLNDVPEVLEAIEKVRTGTATFLQTGFRNEIQDLRAQLTLEQQELLILRLDRGLSWRDIALILQDGKEPGDATALKQHTQTLRKRFGRIKEQLRRHALESGLLKV